MGGGVIRATAKAAGFRGVTAEHFPVFSGTRRAASLRPATSTAEEVKLVASNVEGSVQRQSSAVNDWVFAGGDEDVADSMPRVVFGGVPSLQEAKEATSELTAALEKTYLLSTTSAESEGSVAADNEPCLRPGNSQIVEANGFVGSEIRHASAVPSPAIKAFKFLKESPATQSVVASIACDPNVWNAVLQNQELQGFLQSQRTCSAGSDGNLTAKLVADSNMLHQPSMANINNLSENGESGTGGGFFDIFEKIKGTVVDMMTALSDFFVNLFGGKVANSDGTGKLNDNGLMAGSIFGLAIMAIVVILMKRA